MTMLFDSGSALLYVVTEACDNCPKGMDKFQSQLSRTYHSTEERQSQSYGAGQIDGPVAQDTVCYSQDKLSCIENTSFIAVDHAADIEKDRFSGVAGLSPFQAESTGVPSFLSQGEHVFSLYLSKETADKGKIVLGGWDT